MNKATVLKSVTAVVGAGVAIWLIINELTVAYIYSDKLCTPK